MTNYIVEDLSKMWGGRMPTWLEFKQANEEGRVRVNKTIAARAIFAEEVPFPFKIIYGVITLWAGFLVFPVVLITYFFASFSVAWVIGAAFAAYFLVKVSREGHCAGIMVGAEKSEEFYNKLVNGGAFLFDQQSKAASNKGG